MLKNELSRLALAVVAAGTLSGFVKPILAAELEAGEALNTVEQMVAARNEAGARRITSGLRDRCIAGFSLGGTALSLDQIDNLIASGDVGTLRRLTGDGGDSTRTSFIASKARCSCASGSDGRIWDGDSATCSTTTLNSLPGEHSTPDDRRSPIFPIGSHG